jgi:hypothetical protein
MSDEKTSAIRKVVSETVEKLSDDDKQVVLSWAERSLVVVNNKELTSIQKIQELRKIESKKPVLRLLLALATFLKDKTWTNQSWARRLGISGFAIGTLAFGSQAAGLAAFGTAHAIPLLVATGLITTFLGVVIDEIKNERKK